MHGLHALRAAVPRVTDDPVNLAALRRAAGREDALVREARAREDAVQLAGRVAPVGALRGIRREAGRAACMYAFRRRQRRLRWRR